MRGYKGTDANMRCRGMQYEIGKTYSTNGGIALCKNGLHFCERLVDVFEFYEPNRGNRYFEVEADGDIETDGTKSVARSITILRELSIMTVNRAIYGYGDGYGDGNGYGNGNGYGKRINEILLFVEEEK